MMSIIVALVAAIVTAVTAVTVVIISTSDIWGFAPAADPGRKEEQVEETQPF